MKYIDADKIVAEIERRINIVEPYKDTYESAAASRQELIWMKDFITPLQQEQPKHPGYDMALLEVKSKVDELYKEAGMGLCEYDTGLYNGIAETCMKLRGFIKARLDSDEQPESELEKAAQHVYESWMGGTMNDVCRDMVELGKVLNARKGD